MTRVSFDQPNHQAKILLSSRVASKAKELLEKKVSLKPGSGKFTHKCSCPNPAHKGGAEKTPSFYFSEETGQFFCFGCQAYGDSFDLITLLGGSAEAALKAAMEGGPIEVPDLPAVHKVIEAGAAKITKKSREKLRSYIGTKDEKEALSWFEKFFIRLDNMLVEMEKETPEQIAGRFLQLNMELGRRWK